MTRTLILGGARSGKSAYAEHLAIESGKEVVYIATATAGDDEMADRIQHHRSRRPTQWTTVEEPLALGEQLLGLSAPGRVILIDCLTLWLNNALFEGGAHYPDVGTIALPEKFLRERALLMGALQQCGGDVILVSNEVGMGIVPCGAVARCFADEAGRLNQSIAAICDRAVFIAAGLPLMLKGSPC